MTLLSANQIAYIFRANDNQLYRNVCFTDGNINSGKRIKRNYLFPLFTFPSCESHVSIS